MSDLERIRPELVLGRRPPEVEPELAAAREAWAEIVGCGRGHELVPGEACRATRS